MPKPRAVTSRGTILVAPEGVNLFLAGAEPAVERVLAVLRAHPGFAAIEVKRSWSRAQPFGRLKAKVKPEIITFRREGSAPLEARAPSVSPSTLARWIENGADDAGRRLVLLDTRNREEVRARHLRERADAADRQLHRIARSARTAPRRHSPTPRW